MRDKIERILLESYGRYHDHVVDGILSLLDENTGNVSNSSTDESGVLHDVSDRNASRLSSDADQDGFGGGALAFRTDSENFEYHQYCRKCGRDFWHFDGFKEKCVTCEVKESMRNEVKRS